MFRSTTFIATRSLARLPTPPNQPTCTRLLSSYAEHEDFNSPRIQDFTELEDPSPKWKYAKGFRELIDVTHPVFRKPKERDIYAADKKERRERKEHPDIHTIDEVRYETFKIGEWVRVFIDLKMNLETDDIIFSARSFEYWNPKNRWQIYMRPPVIKWLLKQLPGIDDLVRENEGSIPLDIPPYENLYANKFTDKFDKTDYKIRLFVSDYMKHGHMQLGIFEESEAFAVNRKIIIPSHGIHNFHIALKWMYKKFVKYTEGENGIKYHPVTQYTPEKEEKTKNWCDMLVELENEENQNES